MKGKIIAGLLALTSWLLPTYAYGYAYCSNYYAAQGAAPGALFITLGESMANPPSGTVLGQFHWALTLTDVGLPWCGIHEGNAGLETMDGEYNHTIGIHTATAIPVPGMTYNGEPVYKTNNPEVGIAVFIDRKSGKSTATYSTSNTLQTEPVSSKHPTFNIKFVVIKTGNIFPEPGTYAIVPKFRIETVGSIITPALATESVTHSFRYDAHGSLFVKSNTCEIADDSVDLNVDLGSFKTSAFTGIGSTTPWVPAGISLINCESRRGYTPADGNKVNNKITMTVTPAPSVDLLSAEDGIMALISTSNSATGVGVQVGYGTTAVTPLKFSTPIDITPSAYYDSIIRVPLKGRFIQTEEKVTSGPASSALVYTINYY